MHPLHDMDPHGTMCNSMLHQQQVGQAKYEQSRNEDPQSGGAKPPSMANQNRSDAEADVIRAVREVLASGTSKRKVSNYTAALAQFSDLIRP